MCITIKYGSYVVLNSSVTYLYIIFLYSKHFLKKAHTWFLEIAFVRDVGVCVCPPQTINYIHVIFNLYNQLNKFVMFRNVTKKFFVWAWPF